MPSEHGVLIASSRLKALIVMQHHHTSHSARIGRDAQAAAVKRGHLNTMPFSTLAKPQKALETLERRWAQEWLESAVVGRRRALPRGRQCISVLVLSLLAMKHVVGCVCAGGGDSVDVPGKKALRGLRRSGRAGSKRQKSTPIGLSRTSGNRTRGAWRGQMSK